MNLVDPGVGDPTGLAVDVGRGGGLAADAAALAAASRLDLAAYRETGVRCLERLQGAFALAIVDELRCSLDLTQGQLAQNLDSLYDFMSRQLLQAHVSDKPELLERVAALLQEIRGAWIALPPEARALRREPR